MTLQLLKIEQGLCAGDVLFNEYGIFSITSFSYMKQKTFFSLKSIMKGVDRFDILFISLANCL